MKPPRRFNGSTQLCECGAKFIKKGRRMECQKCRSITIAFAKRQLALSEPRKPRGRYTRKGPKGSEEGPGD